MKAEANVEYDATLRSVTPSSAKAQLSHAHCCYLGISLETEAFCRPRLDATVNWIASHFKQCAVVVGDSVHRYTLQIMKELAADEAAAEAYRIGTTFLAETQDLFDDERCKFEFVRFSELQNTPEFVSYVNQIKDTFSRNIAFAESIRRSANSFVDRRRMELRAQSVTRKRMIDLSCHYIIEEMAVFSCLVKFGWNVEVYPGTELPVLLDIARGKYDGIPEPLKHRINIELKIIGKAGELAWK